MQIVRSHWKLLSHPEGKGPSTKVERWFFSQPRWLIHTLNFNVASYLDHTCFISQLYFPGFLIAFGLGGAVVWATTLGFGLGCDLNLWDQASCGAPHSGEESTWDFFSLTLPLPSHMHSLSPQINKYFLKYIYIFRNHFLLPLETSLLNTLPSYSILVWLLSRLTADLHPKDCSYSMWLESGEV